MGKYLSLIAKSPTLFQNSLVKQYQSLFLLDDVKLTFQKAALKEISEMAIVRKTGARGLRSILDEIMLDVMFDVKKYKSKEIKIEFKNKEFKTTIK